MTAAVWAAAVPPVAMGQGLGPPFPVAVARVQAGLVLEPFCLAWPRP